MLEGIGNCWYCGLTLYQSDYGRQDQCTKCGRSTRTCRGCSFYDPTAHHSCREPQADHVLDKEKSNFCEYFKPYFQKKEYSNLDEKIREKAEALFKKRL